MTIFRNGRPVSFGVGENFCPTLPYNCPPRPWGPDPGPNVSISDRLGTGLARPGSVGVDGLACWPREWKPDEGQALGVGVRGVGVGSGADTLQSGQTLTSGQSVHSANGRGTLIMQPDGNLVLYDGQPQTDASGNLTGKALWASGTSGKPGATAIMQADGNLVVYAAGTSPNQAGTGSLWASGTDGNPGATARVQDDGNLVIYKGKDSRWSSDTVNWTTSGPPPGHGFDLGSALGKAWEAVKQGVGDIRAVADALHIPGANLTAALLTGGDLGEALKQDVNGFVSAGKLAQAVVSGNTSGIVSAVTSSVNEASQKFGITLPGGAVQAAAQVAQTVAQGGGDPTQILTQAAQQAGGSVPTAAIQSAVTAIKSGASPDQVLSQVPGLSPSSVQAAIVAAQAGGDPTKLANAVASSALGDSYKDAWNVATNFGKIKTDMPAPAGLSYQPGAAPATSPASHPIRLSLQKFASAKSASPTAVGSYGPYPTASTSAAGTTAGVGDLDHGGGGHGGGGHGGGGRGGRGGWSPGGRPAFRGRGWGYGARGWGGGVWWPYVVVTAGEAACAAWGDPIDFPDELLPAARTTIIGAAGDPVAVRGADGGLYLISLGGPRLVTVRPCVGVAGVGGADDDVLKAMALDLLSSLRRSVPQGATRSVMSFQQAWNAASSDSQIATDGKYTGETEGALNAALSALAPGSGAVPAAVL